MKYIAKFDDASLSEFNLEECAFALYIKDKTGIMRGVPLTPVTNPILVNPDGSFVYLTQGHIDCLAEYAREQMRKDLMESVTKYLEIDLQESSALTAEELRKQFGLFPYTCEPVNNPIIKLKENVDGTETD